MSRALTASVALLFAMRLGCIAGEQPVATANAEGAALSDLSLGNFFTAGWDEAWTRRARGDGTPDMSLLRVQTNFLARLVRTDLLLQENTGTAATRRRYSLSELLEYPFNRRFMLALIGNYQWLDARNGFDRDGGAFGAFARLQLVDKPMTSVATTVRVGLPNRGIGQNGTTVSFALAGWQDLSPLGLRRCGLYAHVQEEVTAGPAAHNATRNIFTYDVSFAKTWTSPEALFGNATTFLEAYARTDLDGAERGRTLLTLTPGVRATFAHRHILMAGIDLPLNEPRQFDHALRLTYIFNF